MVKYVGEGVSSHQSVVSHWCVDKPDAPRVKCMLAEIMEFQFKPLSSETIPRALERAKNYRLLNEPEQAESICLDILRITPDDREAIVVLVLALTDGFTHVERATYARARKLLPRLQDEYQRTYYEGIICERRGRAHLKQGSEGSSYVAYDWLAQAMGCYEKSEEIRPSGNDDAVLRWNACARTILEHDLEPAAEDPSPSFLE